MTLDEYLFIEGLTMEQFAASIGYGYSYLCMALNGRRNISKKVASAISVATGGKVQFEPTLFPALRTRVKPNFF